MTDRRKGSFLIFIDMLNSNIKVKLQELVVLFMTSGANNRSVVLTQISYLLFLRLISNLSENIINNVKLPAIVKSNLFKKIQWKRFSIEEPEERYELYLSYALNYISKSVYYGNIIREFPHEFQHLIKNPNILADAVRLIDESYKMAEASGMDKITANGEIYDYLLNECLESTAFASGKTPRHIANFMCALTKPSINDRIIDPNSGQGNILVSAIRHIVKQVAMPTQIIKDEDGMDMVDNIQNVVEKENYLRSVIGNSLFGFCNNEQMAFYCAMNMLFHGIYDPKVKRMDALSEEFDNENKKGSYTVVFTNPPFCKNNSKDDKGNLSLYYSTNRMEILYLHRTINLLTDGGRAAIILPEGALFSSDKASIAARKRLLKECKIDTIFSLPDGVFRPYSAVKASIIVFHKTMNEKEGPVWFYEFKNDGYSQTKNRRKLTENPFPEAIRWFEQKIKTDNAFSVEIDEILENDCDLSCGRYKDYNEYKEEPEDPIDIISDVLTKEQELTMALEKLNSMIK